MTKQIQDSKRWQVAHPLWPWQPPFLCSGFHGQNGKPPGLWPANWSWGGKEIRRWRSSPLVQRIMLKKISQIKGTFYCGNKNTDFSCAILFIEILSFKNHDSVTQSTATGLVAVFFFFLLNNSHQLYHCINRRKYKVTHGIQLTLQLGRGGQHSCLHPMMSLSRATLPSYSNHLHNTDLQFNNLDRWAAPQVRGKMCILDFEVNCPFKIKKVMKGNAVVKSDL